jgi:hypothetical protein
MPVYAFQQAVPQIENDELWEQRQKQIEETVDSCEGAASHHRAKLKKFLLESEIMDVTEMDYPLREKYESYLNSHIYKNNVKGYLNIYDRVKKNILAMQLQTLSGRQEMQWKYRHQIEDIELMEQEQIAVYFTQLSAVRKRHSSYDSILNLSRKIAFMNETEIRWDANVWYLEKFNLPESRYNRSKSLDSISFLEITNRQFAKRYMKYELGVNGQALSTVTQRYILVRNFVAYLGEQNVCSCNSEQIDAYIKTLQEKEMQARGFNERLAGIQHFFKFLEVRKYIRRSPFRPEYIIFRKQYRYTMTGA